MYAHHNADEYNTRKKNCNIKSGRLCGKQCIKNSLRFYSCSSIYEKEKWAKLVETRTVME